MSTPLFAAARPGRADQPELRPVQGGADLAFDIDTQGSTMTHIARTQHCEKTASAYSIGILPILEPDTQVSTCIKVRVEPAAGCRPLATHIACSESARSKLLVTRRQ